MTPDAGAGIISSNPLFPGTGTDCDSLVIVFPSPCIDAGDPDPAKNDVAFPPSRGDATNDMVAFGGPGAAGWLPECLPGTVNTRYGERRDVLFVEGLTGTVTVPPGQDINVMMYAADAGPIPGRFVLLAWRGLGPNEVPLVLDGEMAGCLARPSPLHLPEGPQPFRCVLSRGPGLDVPDEYVAGVVEFLPPPAKQVPFERAIVKRNGFAGSAVFTLQGFIEDGAGRWSATNAVILQVDRP